MPGIVGLITKLPRAQAEAELNRMLATMRHESFYETGTWIDETSGVYVGWTARKGGFDAGMPLRNEKGDAVLVFSGEEFSEPGTVQRLQQRGHTVTNEGPGYLVHLYEEDPASFAKLNGRFHGLLTDRSTGTATLFNDRYGIHRVYVHTGKDAFYFAAEAKAILAARPELRSIDPRGLGEFLACGCVLENRTLFQGIQILPPASAWIFRNATLASQGTYFQPREWEEQEILEPEPYYEKLREVFTRNLPRYFEANQKIGVSLTGGLDSRMIMAWEKAAPNTLPCYSFGGMFRDCQDVLMARKVAKICGQTHETIPVAKEFLSNFAKYAERTVYLTDGCVDVSHSPDLYVNQRAAQIAPVRMTGNYGGEVLRRVRAFKAGQPQAGLFSDDLVSHIQAAGKTYQGIIQGHPLSFAVFRQAPWHHYGLLSLEETQLSLRSPYLDNELVQTIFQAPPSVLTNNDVSLRLIADGNTALRQLRTDRGYGGKEHTLPGAMLRNYMEFTFKSEYAYDYGMPQWVSRVDHAFAPLHLERIFLGRHKFYHFRVWYRDYLSSYVRDMLLDPRTLARPYLQRSGVEQVAKGHLGGGLNYTTAIHKILSLELIHRLFLDG